MTDVLKLTLRNRSDRANVLECDGVEYGQASEVEITLCHGDRRIATVKVRNWDEPKDARPVIGIRTWETTSMRVNDEIHVVDPPRG